MNDRFRNITVTAMLAAMTCIATMIIKVPTVGTGGYVNIGDSIVIVSAWMLANPYGALAAGTGSALADLLSGYVAYAPATAVIKFVMAFTCTCILSAMGKTHAPSIAALITGSIVSEIIMTAGYFLYESTILGYGLAASASVVSNAVQGGICIVLGIALITVLSRIRAINELRGSLK